MFLFGLELLVYFLHIYPLNGQIEELFCENTKAGRTSTVMFYTKENASAFINELDSLLDSMIEDVVYLDPPYGICFELHYVFYADQWVINFSIAPDDETSKPIPDVNHKYESISVKFCLKVKIRNSKSKTIWQK